MWESSSFARGGLNFDILAVQGLVCYFIFKKKKCFVFCPTLKFKKLATISSDTSVPSKKRTNKHESIKR